jgi:sugar phosphate permease
VWSIISTSSRIGTILAGVVLGYLLSLVDWRGVFLFSAVTTAAVVVLLYFYLKEQPEQVGLPSLSRHVRSQTASSQHASSHHAQSSGDDPTETVDQNAIGDPQAAETPHPFDGLTLLQVCGRFLFSGRVWFICLSLIHLTIVMDFLTFIPIYLSEALDISASKASMAGSTFPAGMFTALVLTSFVYDRLSKRRLIFVIGGLLIASATCVLALWNLNLAPPDYRTPTAIATIFLLGLTISPAYYIPMSVFSVSFGGKHSGFLVSLIDVFGYCGALVFNFFGGSIAQHYGWSVFLSGLLAITVLAGVYMVTFLTLDWRSSKQVA